MNRRRQNTNQVKLIFKELVAEVNEKFELELTEDDIRLLLSIQRRSYIESIRNKKHFAIPNIATLYYSDAKAELNKLFTK